MPIAFVLKTLRWDEDVRLTKTAAKLFFPRTLTDKINSIAHSACTASFSKHQHCADSANCAIKAEICTACHVISKQLHAMVRTYHRKRATKYTPEALKAAIEAVEAGSLKLGTASRKYNIPFTTLRDHTKGGSSE